MLATKNTADSSTVLCKSRGYKQNTTTARHGIHRGRKQIFKVDHIT